jgi:hypothetical protein
MKAYRRSRFTVPLILKFGTRWTSGAKTTSRQGKERLMPNGCVVGWAPDKMWAFWMREESFSSPEIEARTAHLIAWLLHGLTWNLNAELFLIYKSKPTSESIPVATSSKAWVYGRSLGGIAGSNPTGGMGACLSVVCCQVEVSTSGWSLVQRSPTFCGVSECDREASIMRRPWPTRGCCAMGKKRLPRK